MRAISTAVGVVVLVIGGCGAEVREAASGRDPSAKGESAKARSAFDQSVESSATEPAPSTLSAAGVQQKIERKIIYEAEIELVVSHFATLEERIPALVGQHKGYIAETRVDRTSGDRRSGSWRVRVPVEEYESFLAAVRKLGVAESVEQTSQDVTEEFVDLEARIANEKRLEQRIVELLENNSGEIKDVIEVERELARVRGEIEQMEGRLRYLTNRADLTTVAIKAREEENYVPPEAPGFTARIRRSWHLSLTGLRQFGENFAVAAVFVAPWLGLLLLVFLPAVFIIASMVRRRRRRASGRP